MPNTGIQWKHSAVFISGLSDRYLYFVVHVQAFSQKWRKFTSCSVEECERAGRQQKSAFSIPAKKIKFRWHYTRRQ